MPVALALGPTQVDIPAPSSAPPTVTTAPGVPTPPPPPVPTVPPSLPTTVAVPPSTVPDDATATASPGAAISALVVLLLVYAVVFGSWRKVRRTRKGRKPWVLWKVPDSDVDLGSRYRLTGTVLAVLATTQLLSIGSHAGDGASGMAVVVLAGFLAAAYAFFPGLVGAGISVLAIASLVSERLGVGPCAEAIPDDQNAMFIAATVLLLGTLVALRVLLPVFGSAATRERLLGRQQDSIPSPLAASLLGAFGILELLGFALQPAVLEGYEGRGSPIWIPVLMVGCGAVIYAGVVFLPAFTLSALGAGVAIGQLILLPYQPAECVDVTRLVWVGLAYASVIFIISRWFKK